MDSTMFLSRLIGPVALLLGLALVFRKADMKNLIQHYADHEHTHLFVGLVEFTAGLSIVLKHNVWDSPLASIISIIGWAMVIEGGLGIVSSRASIKKMMAGFDPTLFSVAGVAVAIVGVFLSYVGYFA